jgi:hypothetical protein
MTKQFKNLTETEARQAIYIDFEGGKDQPPVVLGVYRDSIQQYVLDRAFVPAGPRYREPREAIRATVDKAQRLKRRIVSWSEYDLDVVRELTNDPRLVRELEACYGNGRALAARWASRITGIDKPATGDLEHYLALIDFDVPESAGPGRVGKTVRSVRPSLEAGRELTEHQAERWADLLEHNRFDCEGMRAVCVRAATDLERLEKKTRSAKKGRKKRRPGKPKT